MQNITLEETSLESIFFVYEILLRKYVFIVFHTLYLWVLGHEQQAISKSRWRSVGASSEKVENSHQ